MKSSILLGVIAIMLALAGCSPNPDADFQPVRETWMHQGPPSTRHWTDGASQWFLSSKPHAFHTYKDLMQKRITHQTITKLVINGDFKVMIEGTDDADSVAFYGSKEAVDFIEVSLKNGVLCLKQKVLAKGMRHVIVKVNLRHLVSIDKSGCGVVEGVRLHSDSLTICTNSDSNMYLAGDITLRRIIQNGNGTINVFGAKGRALNVTARAAGRVNLEGRIDVARIKATGHSCVRMTDAHSHCLVIEATSKARMRIYGKHIVVKRMELHNEARVIISHVSGSKLQVSANDYTEVGIAGHVRNVQIQSGQSAKVFGQYLCARNAYLTAMDYSHMNISVKDHLFANADSHSSIYFYGTDRLPTEITEDRSIAIRMGSYWMNCRY